MIASSMPRSVTFLLLLTILVCFVTSIYGDVYLNSPRGSNNRLDEANRDRDNGDRMFDSQNNNRGGYNVGTVYYYTGSIVNFEWTAQHACGDKTRANCELVLQYTCDSKLRDGTTTTTIPINPNQCYNYDCDSDLRFGRHESLEYYNTCRYTQRNKGLFLGSQNLQGKNAAINTRQNPGGTRRGLECPEERDYYPYWRPTPWRDIAILTNDPKRCAAYQAESENVKGRSYCQPPADVMAANVKAGKTAWIPINAAECNATLIGYDTTTNTTTRGLWVQAPSHGIDAPICHENQWSRDNHHGNVAGSGGFHASFNWTIPDSALMADLKSERCVLRMRYNISTGDTIEWDGMTVQAGVAGDYTSNSRVVNPQENRDPANLTSIWETYGLTFAEVADSFKGIAPDDAAKLNGTREYVLKNNPRVDLFGTLLTGKSKSYLKTQLAINTAQYGRTFQDRTHRFAIRSRPSDIPSDAKIYNLQVRGKRGNIVQVYPGVEYDFVPNRLSVQSGDYVHFQWTGSNTNPRDNAGNGLDGTDRSNIVIMEPTQYNDNQQVTVPPTTGGWGTSYPGRVDAPTSFAGLTTSEQTYLATLQNVVGVNRPGGQFGGHMDQMDDAGTYFDLGPIKMSSNGIYHYLCTRNNAFSNRSQKGKLVVSMTSSVTQFLGANGGAIETSGEQKISVQPDTFTSLQLVTIAATPKETEGTTPISNQASDFIELQFDESSLAGPDSSVQVSINYANSPLHVISVKRASSKSSNDWEGVSSSSSGGQATFDTRQSGVYAVSSELNGGAVAGIVIGIVIFCAIVAFIVYKVYQRKNGGGGAGGAALSGTQSHAQPVPITRSLPAVPARPDSHPSPMNSV